MGLKYVVDTYALIEWFEKGNKSYKSYFEHITKEGAVLLSVVSLEFYFWIFHKYGEKEAEYYFDIVSATCKEFSLTPQRIKAAAKFRSEQYKKKQKLSYTDCLLWVVAKECNLKVLTGDEHFRNLPCVEFVK